MGVFQWNAGFASDEFSRQIDAHAVRRDVGISFGNDIVVVVDVVPIVILVIIVVDVAMVIVVG